MANEREKIFTDWLEKHKNLMFKVVITYADTAQDQDDLFQEILLQLWSSIPNFQGEAKETTWIYRVALNTALVWIRGETRRKKRDRNILGFMEQSYIGQNFGSLIRDNQVLNQLYNAIRQLSKAESSIIFMHLDGLSYDEMADVLGITNNNVGVKVNRAKKKLAKLMKGLIDEF